MACALLMGATGHPRTRPGSHEGGALACLLPSPSPVTVPERLKTDTSSPRPVPPPMVPTSAALEQNSLEQHILPLPFSPAGGANLQPRRAVPVAQHKLVNLLNTR